MAYEDDQNDKDTEEGEGFFDRIKESPRTVSALIIILIVAAAIYAFSGDQQITPDSADTTDEQAQEEGTTGDDEATVSPIADEQDEPTAATDGTPEATPAATPQEVVPEQPQQEQQPMPQATRTDQGFVEVAETGDGVTHLARRATTRWLSENQTGYNVTNEHRVYIEDYIQNRIGTDGLNLGETRTISFELMQEAVAAAGQLNEQQLQNLSQYTSSLT